MRLLILSDIHGHTEKIPTLSSVVNNNIPDALVICGDITHFGNLTKASTVLKEFTKLVTATFFVPGNCDPPQLASEPVVEGATNLHGRCLSILGVNLIGVGGSIPAPLRTPFELSEDEIRELLRVAWKVCDLGKSTILVSHGPPYGTKTDRVLIGRHVGSKAIRSFTDMAGQALVACGHIHESRAIDSLGATTIVNPGPFHRGFYALAEIGDEISVSLEELE